MRTAGTQVLGPPSAAYQVAHWQDARWKGNGRWDSISDPQTWQMSEALKDLLPEETKVVLG